MNAHKIPLAGVIGSPIAHSRSPALFHHWLRQQGLPGHYIPMDIAQQDLQHVIRTLPKMGFVGVNVTIPHKEAVLGIADSVSDRAAIIGAANTIVFRDNGTIYADNTDGVGFIDNLRASAPHWVPSAGPAAVFGRGRRGARDHCGVVGRRSAGNPPDQPHPRPGRGVAFRLWRASGRV